MKKNVAISTLLIIFGCISSFSFGQNNTVSVANDAKAIHVPVKTKMDIAVEREQKRELKRAKALELQNQQTGHDAPTVKMQQKQVMVTTYDAEVLLEKQVQVKSYKLEVEVKEDQQLEEELQQPENKK